MCAVGLGGSKKEVDLVASDSTNEIDLGSHGLKGKDDWVKLVETPFMPISKTKKVLDSGCGFVERKVTITNSFLVRFFGVAPKYRFQKVVENQVAFLK